MIEREIVQSELRQVFDETTTEVLGRVLGRMSARAEAVIYFGPLLRGVEALLPYDLEEELDPRLSPEEFQEVLRLDLLVKGVGSFVCGEK